MPIFFCQKKCLETKIIDRNANKDKFIRKLELPEIQLVQKCCQICETFYSISRQYFKKNYSII